MPTPGIAKPCASPEPTPVVHTDDDFVAAEEAAAAAEARSIGGPAPGRRPRRRGLRGGRRGRRRRVRGLRARRGAADRQRHPRRWPRRPDRRRLHAGGRVRRAHGRRRRGRRGARLRARRGRDRPAGDPPPRRGRGPCHRPGVARLAVRAARPGLGQRSLPRSGAVRGGLPRRAAARHRDGRAGTCARSAIPTAGCRASSSSSIAARTSRSGRPRPRASSARAATRRCWCPCTGPGLYERFPPKTDDPEIARAVAGLPRRPARAAGAARGRGRRHAGGARPQPGAARHLGRPLARALPRPGAAHRSTASRSDRAAARPTTLHPRPLAVRGRPPRRPRRGPAPGRRAVSGRAGAARRAGPRTGPDRWPGLAPRIAASHGWPRALRVWRRPWMKCSPACCTGRPSTKGIGQPVHSHYFVEGAALFDPRVPDEGIDELAPPRAAGDDPALQPPSPAPRRGARRGVRLPDPRATARAARVRRRRPRGPALRLRRRRSRPASSRWRSARSRPRTPPSTSRPAPASCSSPTR